MELGDMSSLNENIGEAHDFDDRSAGDSQCTFYGRDRGETGTGAKRFKDFADYEANHQYEEYEYILRQCDGKAVWFVKSYSNGFYETLPMAFIREANAREAEAA
jgi:hypothetical protein